MENNALNRISKRVPSSVRREVSKSVAIAVRIQEIMETRGINQKTLAEMLGKRESEISKWLTGMHNFTVQSIVKIEGALNEEIIIVTADKSAKERQKENIERIQRMREYSETLNNLSITRKSIKVSFHDSSNEWISDRKISLVRKSKLEGKRDPKVAFVEFGFAKN